MPCLLCLYSNTNALPSSPRRLGAIKVDCRRVADSQARKRRLVMKRSQLLGLMVGMLCLAVWAGFARAEKAEAPKTVTGKSACATCDGVTSAGHQIMIVAEDGTRWVLVDNEAKGYKE